MAHRLTRVFARSGAVICTPTSAYTLPPPFLLPSLYTHHTRKFSTTPCNRKRETNKKRGLSAQRRTGMRPDQTLSVNRANLPRPKARDEHETDPDHGLWKFFNIDQRSVATPQEMASHGRAWTVEELRRKSFEDLHVIWWKCVYERNRIATEEEERRRLKAGYGENEALERDEQVKLTMRAVKHALTERWYTWQEARKVAEGDPSVRLDSEKAGRYRTDLELEDEYYGSGAVEELGETQDLLEEGEEMLEGEAAAQDEITNGQIGDVKDARKEDIAGGKPPSPPSAS